MYNVVCKLADNTEWILFSSENEDDAYDTHLQIHNILADKDNEYVSISMLEPLTVHRLNILWVTVVHNSTKKDKHDQVLS